MIAPRASHSLRGLLPARLRQLCWAGAPLLVAALLLSASLLAIGCGTPPPNGEAESGDEPDIIASNGDAPDGETESGDGPGAGGGAGDQTIGEAATAGAGEDLVDRTFGEAGADAAACGPVTPWDRDGDGISDSIEENHQAEAYGSLDPDVCNESPSLPAGTYYDGRLAGGLNLTNRGTGYVHNLGGDPMDDDDWGSLELVSCLETAGRAWADSERTLGINDLSRRPGQRFSPHRSHQNGLDADVRYVRQDGRNHPLDIRRNPELYDAAATQELFRLLLQSCDVAMIFVDLEHLSFGDAELGAPEGTLRQATGHSNHFHLRLYPPGSSVATSRLSTPFKPGAKSVTGRVARARGHQDRMRPAQQRRAQPSSSPAPAQPRVAQPATARPGSSQPTAQPGTARPGLTVAPRALNPLVVRRDPADRRTLVLGEIASQAAPVTYRTRLDVLYEIDVAPGDAYTAAIESTDGRIGTGELGEGIYLTPPQNQLVILDRRGRAIRRVESNVQSYIFSPDGKSVAYLVGSYYEGGVGFKPEGTFLLDIETGETQRVNVDGAYELSWSQNSQENALRLRTLAPTPARRVQRYDITSRRISAVPSGAFHLSPDGRYALKKPYELIEEGQCGGRGGDRLCHQIIDIRSGRPVAEALPADLLRGGARPVGWAHDQGHVLAVARVERRQRPQNLTLGRKPIRSLLTAEPVRAETILWDVATARVTQRLDGIPLLRGGVNADSGQWVGSRTQLLVQPVGPASATSATSPTLLQHQPLREILRTRPPADP